MLKDLFGKLKKPSHVKKQDGEDQHEPGQETKGE